MSSKKRILGKLFFFVSLIFVIQNSYGNPLYWNIDKLNKVKSDDSYITIKKKIQNEGTALLATGVLSVCYKEDCSFVSDKHFYVSLAPFWWPDLKNQSGRYVRKDGVINPEVDKYDSNRLLELSSRLKTLSIAYFLSEDKKYLDSYLSLIQCWFIDSATYMYPNMEYSQIRIGHDDNKGRAEGLIDAYNFNDIIESVRLVQSMNSFPPSLFIQLKSWFSSFLQWMQDSEIGIKESEASNNHSIAYDVTLLNISVFVGNKSTQKKIKKSFANRMQSQILIDGSQPEELKRTRAFNYSVYNLSHIIDYYYIQKNLGNRISKKDLTLLRSAIDYLNQYVGYQYLFPYSEIGNWKSSEDAFKRLFNRYMRMGKNIKKMNFYSINEFNNLNNIIK